MVRTFVVLTCLVAVRSVQAIGDISWNYTDQAFWTTVGEWDCDGMRQSPVDVDTDNLVMSDESMNLMLTNFDRSYSGNFTNKGHSVQFDPDEGPPTATFVNHQGTYELKQFHFHWGTTDSEGSEHTVDGTSYSGELHFVTRRTTGDDTDGNAFAVLGVLLTSDDSASSNPTLMALRDNIPTEAGSANPISDVTPMHLLPSNLSYYYYEGSLTTPGCNEVVQWFLLRNPVSLPPAFLESLRTTVEGEDSEILDMNFRMTQDLNGRNITVHTHTDESGGGGGGGNNAAFKAIGKGLFVFVAVIVCLLYY